MRRNPTIKSLIGFGLALSLSTLGLAQQTPRTSERRGAPQNEAANPQTSPGTQSQTTPADRQRPGTEEAGTQARTGQDSTSMVSPKDRKFMTKASESSHAEIQLAEIAEEKASNEKVKELAEKIKEDHEQASEKLKELASEKGISLPAYRMGAHHAQTGAEATGAAQAHEQTGTRARTETAGMPADAKMSGKHAKVANRLSNLEGEQFDRAYVKEMVQHHKKDIREFENYAKKGSDSDLKEYASEVLPKLREHQEMAQNIQAEMGDTRSRSTDRDPTQQDRSTLPGAGHTGTTQPDPTGTQPGGIRQPGPGNQPGTGNTTPQPRPQPQP